jgi:signal transduction histidine kinase/ligand-binding sensor domain-containing protein
MSSCIKYLVIFLCLASANYSSAQNFNPQYNFKQLNVQNGLVQNIVYYFLQDNRGYMWLGTHNGLTMFNGTSTSNFLHDDQNNNSLASNFITRILEDSANNLWIGNEKGIDLYNTSKKTFSHYGVDRPDGQKDNTYCVPLAFVSPTGLWFIDTKTKSIRLFDTKNKSSRFICNMNEVDGTIYIDHRTNTVHFWSYKSNGTVHLIVKENSLMQRQSFFSGSNDAIANPALLVFHVLQQNDSITWLCTNKGLIRLNPIANTFKIYNTFKNKPVKELRVAALSPEGILWVGSGSSGVYTFDLRACEFIDNFKNNRSDPFSICSNNIVSMYFDKSDNVWCGSYDNGASYAGIKNNLFTKHAIDASESPNNILRMGLDNNENCWCIVNDQNGFWVFDKLFGFSKHKMPLQEDGNAFNGSVYKLLFDDDRNAWCATNKGLYLYNRHTNKMHQVKYPLLSETLFGSSWVRDIIKLRNGSFVFSTYSGLYKIKKEKNKTAVTLYSQLNQIHEKSFGLLFEDEAENIYVKGDDSLFILKEMSHNELPTMRKAIPFPSDVNQYFSDSIQNTIYLATNNGIYIVDKNNFYLRKETFEPKIPFQSVSSLFEKDKKMWLFGEKGLYYFDKQNKQGRTFTVEDGLPGNEFNVSAITFSKDGKCIVGSTNGLVSFYPARLQKNLYPPRPQIDHIYINDVLNNEILNPNETDKMVLTYQQNTIAFDFAAIAFQHNTECSFEYKLERYDEDWIKNGTTRYTRYNKIPPGKYAFHLRAFDANGILSPFTKTIGIQISKAFWQTDLFRLALLLILLLIGRFVVKWYLAGKIRKQKIIFEKQQAVEQERTRIAMEMHDDLGSGLTAIRYLAGSLSAQASSATQDKANKIARSAKSLVDSMNDIIWTMKSDNNTIVDVLAYIRKQVAEQLESADIKYSFDFSENNSHLKLSSEQKRNLLLISKEAIHNIIKHSNATKVWVIVQLNDNSLVLIIKDNGKGFDPEKTTQFGNGLGSMRRRAQEVNAQLSVLTNEGTVIKLTLPFG